MLLWPGTRELLTLPSRQCNTVDVRVLGLRVYKGSMANFGLG